MSNYDATGGEQGWIMKSKLNELRLDAGIARIENQQWLCVLDKETGMMIDPMIGLEKFAELIVRECAALAKSKSERIQSMETDDRGDQAQIHSLAWQFEEFGYEIKKHFGVKE